MNENDMVIKDARTLGLPKMLLLGLQHMFAMFGATILVPILVNTYFEGEGLSIQVTLMCAGLGTLFFHACSKLKVPAIFEKIRDRITLTLEFAGVKWNAACCLRPDS